MEEIAFQLPYTLDYIATLAWALTGAVLAARRGYDISGVTALALVSATGGGLLRDGLFLQTGPPVLVRSPNYIVIVLVAVAIVQVIGLRIARWRSLDPILNTVDAVGIGAYAVVGMQLAQQAGLNVLGVVLVGLINATAGGMLRDIITRAEPQIFKPSSLFAVAVLTGCIVYQALILGWNLHRPTAAWITIAIIFAVRMLAVYLKLHTRPMPGYVPGQSDQPW